MSDNKMNPLPTGQFKDNIFAVNNEFVSWLMIKSNSGYVAIDMGVDNDKSSKEIASFGASFKDIVAVILTHDHRDHKEGLSAINKGTPVYGRSDEFATIKVQDEQSIDIDGLNFKVYATPGHKEDHISLVLNNKYLITGDCMSLDGNKVNLFVAQYNLNNEQQTKDIKRLSKIPNIEYLITTHFGAITSPDFSNFRE